MICELLIGKDMEGSGCNISEDRRPTVLGCA
jgi:hypothetical protein